MSHTHKADRTLVVTVKGDAHVPFVTRHLKREHILIDPTSFVNDGHELSYSFDGHELILVYDGKPVTDIGSVWCRRHYMPELDELKVSAAYKSYALSSIQRHSLNLYGLFQDAFWLSDYYTIQKAESKPRQLQLAAQLGFRVPETLFTSDSGAAKQFITSHGQVVTKHMASHSPIVNGKLHYFYATKLSSENIPDLGGLNIGPAIFQEAIDVAQGLRITVVGEHVFAAGVHDVHHQDHPDITDWRRAYNKENTRFESFNLPKELQDRCVALTKALGLQFGAIDIMLDTKGKYWFLEINPNGQWAFVEEDTGLPIGEAIAHLLEAGHT
jgi:glutathione synthase/RimK-type ligase-like ATP-grasp enzyme